MGDLFANLDVVQEGDTVNVFHDGEMVVSVDGESGEIWAYKLREEEPAAHVHYHDENRNV